MTEPTKPQEMSAVGWLALVVLLGLVLGLTLAFIFPQVVPAQRNPPPPPDCVPPACNPNPNSAPAPNYTLAQLLVIVGTEAVILLVALLVVYGKIYRDTKAPQMFGICLVVVAFLVETVLLSPFVIAGLGLPPGGLEPFLLVATAFEDLALATFLYLSLQ